MTWQPAYSVEPIHLSSCAVLAYTQSWHQRNEVVSVSVPITSLKPRPSLPLPLDYCQTEALDLRAAMMRDRQAAINRRDMRAVHEIESDLRDVTRAILTRGV